MIRHFAREFRGQRPFYEIWFGKLDLPDRRAFWFRYTLMNGAVRDCSSWAVLFEDGGRRIAAGKDVMGLGALARKQLFHAGAAQLDDGLARGRAGTLAWDLRFESNGRAFEHVPLALKALRLAKAKYSACLLDLRFHGRIAEDGEEIPVDGARGMIGHIVGKKQAHAWAWAHCNSFDGAPDAVFEGLSARVKVGARVTPPLSSFVLFLDDRRFAFRSTLKIASAKSDWAEGRWRFSTRARGATLEGELRTDPGRTALVRYDDTDGSTLYCFNSKVADLSLRLKARGLDRELTATGTSAFEITTRETPSRRPVI